MTIILDHVSKTYDGKEVLKDFYLEVEDKRIYQVVGPSGSGKTTVLKIFLGEEKPDVGRVARMGDYKYPTLQSAYVPQVKVFKEKKSALWHVKKAHRKVSTGRALEELLYFLPEERVNCPIIELSEAEKGFVAIVRALAIPADFIVLDEPFAGMDEDQMQKALAYVLDKQGSRPILLATKIEIPIKNSRVIGLNLHIKITQIRVNN